MESPDPTLPGSSPARFRWPSPLVREVLFSVALGVVLAAATLVLFPAVRTPSWETLLAFAVFACVGETVAIQVRHGAAKESITLFEPALVASALITPPWVTLSMVVLAHAFAAVVRRELVLVKTAFNVGSQLAAASLLVMLYRTVAGTDAVLGAATTGRIGLTTLAGLVLGTLAFTVVNLVLLYRVLYHVTGVPASTNIRAVLPLALVGAVGSVAVGATIVVMYRSAPALLPLMVLAGGGLIYGYFAATRTEREVERSSQLVSLSNLISREGSGEDLLGSFLELTRTTFEVDAAFAVLDGASSVVVESTSDGVVRRPLRPSDRALLELDPRQEGRPLTGPEAPEGWSRALAVPLELDGTRTGMVVLASNDRHTKLSGVNAALLTSLVSSLAAAQRSASLAEHLQAVTSSQGEAVIALDDTGHVTFLNPAAEELLRVSAPDALGQPYRLLFGLEQESVPVDLQSVATSGARLQGDDGRLRVNEDRVYVHYTVSPIRPAAGGTRRPGVVLALVDVTEERRAREELLASQEQLAHLGRTLQRSLLPPVLPELPGAQLAARYHAGAVGLDVGGDFYDVFDILEDSWAVVIGDVCGRGAEAAALTALTRHTFRAAAMRETSPARLLETLNEAILRHHGDDRFCTVAAARLRLGSNPSIRVSCAGHPSPYLVRANGTVREIGAPGTLLGILPEIEVGEEEVPLRGGDVLVFFTDGVIEAKSPDGKMFGEVAFEPLLARCANLPAGEVALRIEEGLERFRGGPPDDDTAFVVISLS